MYGFSDFDGWLKLIHVIASVLWVGGALLLQIFGARTARADQSRRLHFAEQAHIAGRIFSASGAIVLLAGVWLVARIDLWEFSHAWISIGFLGVAVGFVLGIGFFGPQTRALISALEGGSPEAGPIGKRIAMVAQIDILVLIVVLWAMVFKPGL
jgi:uncharacterized membrane protein